MLAKVLCSVWVACAVGASTMADGAAAAPGDLTQKPGLAGCLSETGAGPCTDATGLQGAFSIALAPGGTHAYVAGLGSFALSVYDRAADGALNQKPDRGADGTLTQKTGLAACISTVDDGDCIVGRGIIGARDVKVSADGKSVYVASNNDSVRGESSGVAIFDRAPSGVC